MVSCRYTGQVTMNDILGRAGNGLLIIIYKAMAQQNKVCVIHLLNAKLNLQTRRWIS